MIDSEQIIGEVLRNFPEITWDAEDELRILQSFVDQCANEVEFKSHCFRMVAINYKELYEIEKELNESKPQV